MTSQLLCQLSYAPILLRVCRARSFAALRISAADSRSALTSLTPSDRLKLRAHFERR